MEASSKSGAQLGSLAYIESGAQYDQFHKVREACGQKGPFPVRKVKPEEVKSYFGLTYGLSLLSRVVNKARKVCPGAAEVTPLTPREKEVQKVRDTFLKVDANRKKMLAEVYKTLIDSERSAVFNLTGATKELLNDSYPYSALLVALGVPDSVVDNLRAEGGDLTSLSAENRDVVVKALIVLAIETNALKSIQFVDEKAPIALARAVHMAMVESGIMHADTLKSVLSDEEQSEQFFGELLGNPDYRVDLKIATFKETHKRGQNALQAIGQDEGARRAMTTLLGRLYLQRFTMLENKADLPEPPKPFSEDLTMEELAVALKFEMGIDLPSQIMLAVQLCVADKNYARSNPDEQTDFERLSDLLRGNNPLIADLMMPPSEDDGNVDYAPCRKYHAAAFHEAGCVGGKDGSDDAMRVATYLYMRGDDVDPNRLVSILIKQGADAPQDSAIRKMLDILVERQVIATADDSSLAPNGDLCKFGETVQDADFIVELSAALETSDSVVELYKALRTIGNEEVAKVPEGTDFATWQAAINHAKCVHSAQIMVTTMESIVSEGCHNKFFKVSLAERRVAAAPAASLYVVPDSSLDTQSSSGVPVGERAVSVVKDDTHDDNATGVETDVSEESYVDAMDFCDSASNISRHELERLADEARDLRQDLSELEVQMEELQGKDQKIASLEEALKIARENQEEMASRMERKRLHSPSLLEGSALSSAKRNMVEVTRDDLAGVSQALTEMGAASVNSNDSGMTVLINSAGTGASDITVVGEELETEASVVTPEETVLTPKKKTSQRRKNRQRGSEESFISTRTTRSAAKRIEQESAQAS
ncbi:hypothetical protein [Sansalvadorimonas verongulae]|uniref:hypothetical protein n=1 Tax=Sansalvadorimonas verongulae TaxID=2172824 RepID=UPI0012BB8F99|nr:hypothetical protein [Sansalvadorimonas verongulae]MTI13776.1 hypothetical protein [Sansalvadorimonas verongulae]